MMHILKFNSPYDLPEAIFEYGGNKAVTFFNFASFDNFNMASEETRRIFLQIEQDLLLRRIAPADVEIEITNRLKLSPEQTKKLTVLVLEEFCGPLKWYFQDLEDTLKKYDEILLDPHPFAVPQPQISTEQVISEIMEIAGDAPERVKNKLIPFVNSVLRSANFDSDFILKRLTAGITTNGFGFPEERARKILNLLKKYVGAYDFTDIAGFTFLPAGPSMPAIEPNATILKPHEASEIAVVAEIAKTNMQASAEAGVTQQEQALINSIMSLEGAALQSDDSRNRFQKIVTARVKGVRDAVETRRWLELSSEQGGIGLSEGEADRVSGVIEKTVFGIATKREELSVMKKISEVQKQAEPLGRDADAMQAETQKELDERFRTLFGRRAVEEIRRETHREIESPDAAHPNEVGGMAVATSAQQPPKYVPKIPEKLKQIIDAEHPIFPTHTARPEPRPKTMRDVAATSSVLSPIDELQRMTIVDWRRLSPDTSVRSQKIKSKIDVIGKENAADRLRAFAVVEQSEPIRVYRTMLRATLVEQMSMDEVAKKRESAGEPALTPEEIQEIKNFLPFIRYVSS